eukprot:TRINITY_DN17055_c0_g1_i1.p2 TRINITY_DN17055_c0_g1~~TRINITY_DN17055_c0_g1_i1.p2  ORF type:complete len:130 (+),score=34.51 TRINITY_DN17055_c0_g1_i1:20-409(+)
MEVVNLSASVQQSIVSQTDDVPVTFTIQNAASDSLVSMSLPEAYTVADIKKRIQDTEGVSPEYITLVLNGKEMADKTTLKEAGIQTNTRITSEYNLNGGGGGLSLDCGAGCDIKVNIRMCCCRCSCDAS